MLAYGRTKVFANVQNIDPSFRKISEKHRRYVQVRTMTKVTHEFLF